MQSSWRGLELFDIQYGLRRWSESILCDRHRAQYTLIGLNVSQRTLDVFYVYFLSIKQGISHLEMLIISLRDTLQKIFLKKINQIDSYRLINQILFLLCKAKSTYDFSTINRICVIYTYSFYVYQVGYVCKITIVFLFSPRKER